MVGSRVVLLVGSGGNGGDALWAGARLSSRGCRVDALTLTDRPHEAGTAALRSAGGLVSRWDETDSRLGDLLDEADLIVDGIVGIGAAGALRADAAALADRVAGTDALVVAVDVPSGVDADTGVVQGSVISADVTVTFGAVKPGLLLAPGRHHAGDVVLVEIGLSFPGSAIALSLQSLDVAEWVPEPEADTYKYRRGVVGVCAGSLMYPGAATLAVSAARRANVGMVRYLDRGDGLAALVVSQFPDIVIDGSPPADQSRVDSWVCGPGLAGDESDGATLRAVLAARVPVVLDAGALSVLATDAGLRDLVVDRSRQDLLTCVTPHDGEFERLLPGRLSSGRQVAALEAADRLGALVVLKGPGTVIASPQGECFIDIEGTADLGVAGSGDVLSGLLGGILASAWSDGSRTSTQLLEVTAAAVWLHGAAGRVASLAGPVVAPDIVREIPSAIQRARRGDSPGDQT